MKEYKRTKGYDRMRLTMIEQVHKSYMDFFTKERMEQLEEIERQIGIGYTPKCENVLRFARKDLQSCKVVWLGQDPYFQPGVANGRSFQPNDLEDWKQPFKQVSLKNILRLVYASYYGVKEYTEIKKYKEILTEIEEGTFPIKQPREWFDSLEEQGVLFLNTSLTCRVNEANSHKKIWSDFSKDLLQYISERQPNLVWFLWGKESIEKREYIQSGKIIASRHPMMCSKKFEDDFLKSSCFKETAELIRWLG